MHKTYRKRSYSAHGCGNPRAKGFTIVELLVVMLIGAILAVSVVSVFVNQTRAMALNEDLVDLEQNLRVGMDMLHRDVRMAGAYVQGAFPPFVIGGIDYDGDGVDELNSEGGVGTPDAIMLQLSPDPGLLIVNYPGTAAVNLRVCSPSGLQVGQILPLSESVSPPETRSIEVTSIASVTCNGVGCPLNDCDKINFSPGLSSYNTPGGLGVSYDNGRVWARLETITYFISGDANGDGVSDDPALMRVSNRSVPVIVAFGINNLQVEYILDDGSVSVNPVAADVRRVSLTLSGETRNAHKIGGLLGKRNRTMTTEILVRNLAF